MDVHVALQEVTRWCTDQTAAQDSAAIEVECHATLWITIAECSPPWRVRLERGSSAGASSPIAQLRYHPESRDWTLHHGERPDGWCNDEDAVRAHELGVLLDEI